MAVAPQILGMGKSVVSFAARCPGVRLAVALSVLVTPATALACFFYEPPIDTPVVTQTGLQVVLVQRGGSTRMILGARTEGQAEDLGWIVAVPEQPSFAEAPENLFSSLDEATRPIFRISSGGGSSMAASDGGAGCGGAREAGALPDADDGTVPGVQVWDSQIVGAYELQTITATTVTALQEWVEDEGLPWRPETAPGFQHYIDEGYFFVAAKVIPTAESIVPISVEYPSAAGDIRLPILLSKADAGENMGILVWIIADQPARPGPGWARVAVPEGRIIVDEENESSNYAALVETAVEAAPGHVGFVTEYVQQAGLTALRINDQGTAELLGTEGVVTRLYTQVDPDELVEDPVFQLDESLPTIDQIHDLTVVEDSPYYGAAWASWSLAPFGLFVLGRRLLRRAALSPAGR